MFKIIGFILSFFMVPILSILGYVYYKHSLYCDNSTGIKTPFFEIKMSVGSCDPWTNASEELSDFMSRITIESPEAKSLLDKNRFIQER